MENIDQQIANLTPAKRALLELRLKKGTSTSFLIRRRTERETAILSFAQQRLWFLDQLEPGNAFYNMPQATRIRGALNVEALREAFVGLVKRHEMLRTTFRYEEGTPVQIINPRAEVELGVIDLSGLEAGEREREARRLASEEARRPFDLAKGPLMRVGLLRLGEADHVLLMTLHHIISDGWSSGVLFRELAILYEASQSGQESPLAELPIQYADFAVWQREWLQGEVLEEQVSYWRGVLGDNLPVLDLPTDRIRPAVQTYHGNSCSIVWPKELVEQLRQLGQREEITLYMLLLAAFQVLLSRYTEQEDIIVGSPVAGRNRAETEGLIGFFVNTLVMRTDLSGNPTFRELLLRVREVALDAYAHQDLPFEKLVEELQPDRDLSQNPIFQVMFALQNAPGKGMELGDLELRTFGFENRTTRFDMEVHLWERENGSLTSTFVYNTDLFEVETVEGIARHYQTLLESIVRDAGQRIQELPMLSADEQAQIIESWNETGTEYPRAASIGELFEAQVEQRGEAVAVVYGGAELSYRELNERANRLGRYLQRLGVGPGVMVAISVERSLELIVGLLGIIKAGGAYVPLDAEYPRERLAYLLGDTQAPVLVTEERVLGSLPESGARVVCLDREAAEINKESGTNLGVRVGAESLAYVMYTSGSTGRPKGVEIRHRSVVRLVKETNYAKFTSAEVFLQFAPISFDASTLEVWGALLNGGRLAVMAAGLPSLEELGRAIRENGVTTLWLTAGLFHQMVESELGSLSGVRQLLAGGDVLSVSQVEKVIRELPECRLINGYGPTENTTFTCCYGMGAGTELGGSVPIGRPISNTEVYILDQRRQPVPVGVAGELYIGGDGLARGYLNRPELTAEKFVGHPFSKEPEARLYRTGDRVRYQADGNIEFLGRIDQQVKIRGYRIELGEIEAVLSEHPAVKETVVIARHEDSGDKRLVAYVMQDSQYHEPSAGVDATNEVLTEQLTQWKLLYDQLYGHVSETAAGTFNLVGWNSSYTGEPIAAEEMREWVESTAERILDLEPRRVLEIGCGTGLLLFKVAPQCEEYRGVDFSLAAINYLKAQLQGMELPQVRVEQGLADELEAEPGRYDVVVINSVIQYFPNVEYLVRVMERAVHAVGESGTIFIGDVRNLPLLEAFHVSIGMAQAASEEATEELSRQVRRQVNQEEELVIDPGFFQALKERMPRIKRVDVMPKRGWRQNELSCYRYDVLVQVGEKRTAEYEEVEWVEWEREGLTVARLKQELEESQPRLKAITKVPNARVWETVKALQMMANEDAPKTVNRLRQAVMREGTGVEPEAIWSLSKELPYRAEISWSRGDETGSYDVLLRRQSDAESLRDQTREVQFPGENIRPSNWGAYANNPLQATFTRKLVPQLRHYLKEKLPEYMIPGAFVVLDEMPLTANGKVDRRRLPAPERTRSEVGADYVRPRNVTEELLANMWSEVLGIEQVGVLDDFFALGGHSLLATQVISRVRNIFEVEVPLRSLFESPTVAGLAISVAEKQSEGKNNFNNRIKKRDENNPDEIMTMLDHLSATEVDSLLNKVLAEGQD